VPIVRKLLNPRLADFVHTEYRKGTKASFFHLFTPRSTHSRFQLHFASYLEISALQFVGHSSLLIERKDLIPKTDPRWLKIGTMTVGVARTACQYPLIHGIAGVPSSGRGNERSVHDTRLPRYRGSSEPKDTEIVHLAYYTHDIGTGSLHFAQWRVWYVCRTVVQEQAVIQLL
jgi:hypothetical protein